MTTDLCAARWLLWPARALAQPVRAAGIRATAAKTSDDLAPLLADVPPLSSTAAVAIGRGGRDSRSGRLRHPSPTRGGVSMSLSSGGGVWVVGWGVRRLVGLVVAEHGEQDVDSSSGQADQGGVVSFTGGAFAVVVGAAGWVFQAAEC